MGQKAGGVAIGIVFFMIAFIMFPLILTSTEGIVKAEVEATGAVTTGAGVYCGNVTLLYGLYDDDLVNVISIESTEPTDTPEASSYSSSTEALQVCGLAQSDSRTLTVTYYWERSKDWTGLSDLAGIAPLIIFIGLIGVGIVVIYKSVTGSSGG